MSLTIAVALTQHFGMAGDYNETHPSIRYTHDHFIAGAYLNSEGNVSPYAGLRYDAQQFWIEGGVVFGYEAVPVAPYARAGYDFTDSVGVFIAPAYEMPDTLGVVVGLEFTFR